MCDRNMSNWFAFVLAAGCIVGGMTNPVVSAETSVEATAFVDHGVCAAVARSRGTVATVDGRGKPVILTWMGVDTDTYAGGNAFGCGGGAVPNRDNIFTTYTL